MTEEQKPKSQILEELESLGQQIVAAMKALWESEESRKLRQELGEGFAQVGRQIDSAVKSAQESEAAKKFEDQVRETVEKARESDVAAKVEEGLVTGFRELNKGISKLIDSLEADADQGAAAVEGEPEDETTA